MRWRRPVAPGFTKIGSAAQRRSGLAWRWCYTVKVLCDLLGARSAEIKALLRQSLEAERAQELRDQMLAASLPV
jgi:hypothetical protein